MANNLKAKAAEKIASKPLTAEGSESNILDKISVVKPEPKTQQQATVTKAVAEKTTAKQAHQTWVVRLATFGNPKNAERLAARLQQDGYEAYTQASKRADKDYTFVLVGANSEKQVAKKLSNDLQFKYDLKGLVVEQKSDRKS